MRHNCTNCGNRFEGDVCPECGTKLPNKKASRAAAISKFETGPDIPKLSDEQRQKNKRAFYIMCALGALLVIFVLWRNGYLGGNKYESVIENYFVSICESDFDKYVSSQPERIANGHITGLETLGYEKEQYMSELYADYFAEFGADMSVTLEIGNSKAPETVVVNYFLRSYTEIYGEELEYTSFLEVPVTATFAGSVSKDVIEFDCFVMKSKGKWYIVGCDYATEEVTE